MTNEAHTRIAFGDARLPERFWSKVVKAENGCWIWTAATHPNGYGKLGFEKRSWYSHRFAYTRLRGPIVQTLDHLCRQKACVNPEHLEDVSLKENILRSDSIPNAAALRKARTHCLKGHPYTPGSFRVNPADGARICRICARMADRKHKDKLAVASEPIAEPPT